MLEVDAIEKRFGGRELLRKVSFRGAPAELVVITGENGSGKTTLLRVVAGLIEPSSGSVRIAGFSLAREPVRAKAHLGYVPDGLDSLPELLVSEFVALVLALRRTPDKPAAAIDQRWRELLGVNDTWGQRLRSLSFGQRKRVTLLAALTGTPEVLILDEPTNGLDAAGTKLMEALIDERRRAALTTLLCTNDPELESRLTASRYQLAGGLLTPR
jgi:ABC-type multidrug transport system ATPase subunit